MAEEERHIIRVPNWVWRYAQEMTGKSRPASFLVDLLSEAVHLQQAARASALAASVEEEDDEEEPVPGPDKGRVIVTDYSTVCDECGMLIEEDERALIRRNPITNRKDMFHLDHLRRGGSS